MTPRSPSVTSIVIRERRKRRYFTALATLGVIVLMVELCLNWFYQRPIEWMPVLIGMVIALAGFWGLDSRKAHAAGDFIADTAINVLAVLRTGRRATDGVVAVTAVEVCKNCGKSQELCECPDDATDVDVGKDEAVERPRFAPRGD